MSVGFKAVWANAAASVCPVRAQQISLTLKSLFIKTRGSTKQKHDESMKAFDEAKTFRNLVVKYHLRFLE